MKTQYPFHRDYARALVSGDVPALRKLIRRALRAKPQKEFFSGDKMARFPTHFEELVTAVWRTFECCHREHGRLFLEAGLPPNLPLPDVEGLCEPSFTPLEVTVFAGGDEDPVDQAGLVEMLLEAGADHARQIWPGMGPSAVITGYVRTVELARVLHRHGVPKAAFVLLPPHLRASL